MCCISWVNAGFSKVRPDLRNILGECQILKVTKKINLMWEGRDFNLAGIVNEKIQKHFREINRKEKQKHASKSIQFG